MSATTEQNKENKPEDPIRKPERPQIELIKEGKYPLSQPNSKEEKEEEE